ncbi:probable transcriptional regulatory protein TTE1135 [Episyrphus balteatus]|uniref:probable transcriptional regulatory protein TTE1135 n=1 Tax=Episyrphus balteatus TaxID=286459 RepID=UPI0024869C17|nr:probable transcriptional regulatory protein TTE1135 [Episyrphus balteatus]
MLSSRVSFLSNNKLSFKIFYDNITNYIHTSAINNAGHSKWANIRHIKALKDGQKSALFTRYSRQIRIAIQDGGSPDPALNTQLRNIIDNALRKNMPMATIQNCIKKTSASKVLLKKHFLYWRFQHKVFAICSVYTENFAQFKMELAPILRKAGTVYVEGQHMFDDVGMIEAVASDENISKSKSVDELEQICTEDAIECGVEEVEVLDHTKGIVNFLCNPIELGTVSRALEKRGYLIENAEHIFIPKNTVELSEVELKTYENFLNKIRELPGIEAIYDNVKSS